MIKNLHIKYIYVLLIALLYTYDLSMKCYFKSLICHDSLFSLLTILQSTNASKMSLGFINVSSTIIFLADHDHSHQMLHLRQGDWQQVGGLPRPPPGRVPGGRRSRRSQSQEVSFLPSVFT